MFYFIIACKKMSVKAFLKEATVLASFFSLMGSWFHNLEIPLSSKINVVLLKTFSSCVGIIFNLLNFSFHSD